MIKNKTSWSTLTWSEKQKLRHQFADLNAKNVHYTEIINQLGISKNIYSKLTQFQDINCTDHAIKTVKRWSPEVKLQRTVWRKLNEYQGPDGGYENLVTGGYIAQT